MKKYLLTVFTLILPLLNFAQEAEKGLDENVIAFCPVEYLLKLFNVIGFDRDQAVVIAERSEVLAIGLAG